MKKYLPLGSVVLLRAGTRKLMIYGRKIINASDGKTYDYIGCLYPEGLIDTDHTYPFNADLVNDVIFRGYENEEENEMQLLFSQLDEKARYENVVDDED